MNLYFYKYKFISITWFMFFFLVCTGISYIIINFNRKDYDLDKEKTADLFFYLIIFSFIGARLSYVLFNMNLYKNNIFSILSLNHYNLYLLGGIITGVFVILIFSRKYNMNFNKLISFFLIPFYFSMMIGVWNFYFDRLTFLSITKSKIKFMLIILSFIFFSGIVLESVTKNKSRYTSLFILCLTIAGYYFVKMLVLWWMIIKVFKILIIHCKW